MKVGELGHAYPGLLALHNKINDDGARVLADATDKEMQVSCANFRPCEWVASPPWLLACAGRF
jgi:hypothetical protein